MTGLRLLLLGLLLCPLTLPARAEGPARTPETADIERQLAEAAWPADIVHLADVCLGRHGRNACETPARQLREQASRTEAILATGQVNLTRNAFLDEELPDSGRADLRLAGLGDPAAALRIARFYQQGAPGAPANARRYIGWLQLAGLLGNGAAAYEVALYFRKEGQPAIAAVWESRAIGLGFQPPAALDQTRK